MNRIRLTLVTGTGPSAYDDVTEVTTPGPETTAPVGVNPDHVRSYQPRKEGKVGTLLIFANSAMFSVQEDFETVDGLIAGTGAPALPNPEPATVGA